jgi:hypothetical protein
MEIVEKAYFEKCFELEKNNDHFLEMEQQLRSDIKEERKKRRELWRRYLVLQATLNFEKQPGTSSSQSHSDSRLLSSDASAENSSFPSSNDSMTSPTSPPPSPFIPFEKVQSLLHTPPDISPHQQQEQEGQAKDASRADFANHLAMEMENRSEILQLISEKNFWWNQTLSLRKEVTHLSRHLSVISRSGLLIPFSLLLSSSWLTSLSGRVFQLSKAIHNQ